MVDGVGKPARRGRPQGSPLYMANIMLDDLDWGVEAAGHRFVRYADDIRVHVKSERQGNGCSTD